MKDSKLVSGCWTEGSLRYFSRRRGSASTKWSATALDAAACSFSICGVVHTESADTGVVGRDADARGAPPAALWACGRHRG